MDGRTPLVLPFRPRSRLRPVPDNHCGQVGDRQQGSSQFQGCGAAVMLLREHHLDGGSVARRTCTQDRQRIHRRPDTIIGGRVVPARTSAYAKETGGLHVIRISRQIERTAAVATACALVGWAVAPQARLTGVACATAAACQLMRAAQWRGWQAVRLGRSLHCMSDIAGSSSDLCFWQSTPSFRKA
jgi:hypothetical protein